MQVAHRSALANALYEGCKAAAPRITFHFRTTVVGVDFDTHRVQVKEQDEEGEGHWVDADVVLGADGVKSVVRKCMLARHGEDGDGMCLLCLPCMPLRLVFHSQGHRPGGLSHHAAS
jgi:2-polyprenyl-6-methoxyphenol hydroxylase-like FAD-dependent oxidoreductase